MTQFDRTLIAGLLLTFGACGTSKETLREVPPEPTPLSSAPDTDTATTLPDNARPPSPPQTITPVCTLLTDAGGISRPALRRLIEGGLGRWLQNVEGDRAIAKGRFQGWLIKSLHPKDPCYARLPLRPGDIVTKVNGKSIERPEQAFEVVENLRTASAVVVDYLRNGSPQSMRLDIQEGN